ncbi:DUF411 domain-containing protein [Rhizobium sp. ARZ01]|uniref:DUF411 domain-containing protein n=1 Tax=Rhizobium sp. ARZ01 TaxID=2769313 RepID=UPI00177B4650|nr:DUF411 domain-containing protein [Rhizobium sp. ARZ01]MBD9373684.1 DUF411 domain-containing protein [Rhizobium sp. ARZ01]
MKRRQFLCSAVAVGSLLLVGSARAARESMVVYKDPNCGCCEAWAEAMKAAGYSVTIENVDDLDAIKQRYAIPAQLHGCHTAIVAGYYLEGHVPLESVTRLLAERPAIVGLAVPGMPAGSLGMGDDPRATYDVLAVAKDGSSTVYQEVRPKG